MPYKIDAGFVKADSTNLPKINVFQVWEYIVTDERYNAPEVRGVKATLSSRENYGDSAIGYVAVKREGYICTVKGKICPEHRVRVKDYNVILTVNEQEEKIERLECFDCAASEGGCKHGLAFLMWCNRRYESASPTEIECYWKKSTLSSFGTAKKFITTSEMVKNEEIYEDLNDNSNFLNEIIEKAKAKQLDSQLTRYSFELEERKVYSLSIHHLLFNFYVGHSNKDFIKYAKEKMNDDLCKEAEEKTKDQKHNCLWHELRFERITASTVYEASRCRATDGSLVHRVVGAAKVFDNVYMKRGRQLEDLVIIELEKKLQIKIKKCGLFLIPSLPMLGASPDGIGQDFIVEIKCPSSEKTVQNYKLEGQISEKCKGQIHLQMMAAKKKKALFCVAHPQFENNKEFQFLWIDYDQKFTMNMTERAVKFWKKNIFPILFKSFTG